MPKQLDREGNFLATVQEIGIRTHDTGSVMVNVLFGITHELNPVTNQWVDWSEYDLQIYGSYCVVTKAGQALADVINRFKTVLGWDGRKWRSLQETDWSQVAVQVLVRSESDGKGGQKMKAVRFGGPEDSLSGGVSRSSDDELEALQKMHGAKLRALASPAAPVAPASPSPVRCVTPKATPPVTPAPQDDIPF